MHLRDKTLTQDPFPPSPRHDDDADRRAANHAVGVSAVGLAVTGLIELLIAVFSGSVALLGDALHNLSDVSTSAMVFIGLRMSKRHATPARSYGYDRAEDLAGLGVAAVIWASAALAGWLSWHKLTEHGHTSHLAAGMAAAAVGVVGNQVVARYKLRVGRRIQSATLVGDAQHSWLDALSSLGALVGLAGVAVGWQWADAAAGLAVTLFIVHVGWEVTRELLEHLIDGVDPRLVIDAERAASDVAGVRHAQVRARWAGRALLIDVDGYVDPGMTIQASDTLGGHVQDAVFDAVPQARTVLWSAHSMLEADPMPVVDPT